MILVPNEKLLPATAHFNPGLIRHNGKLLMSYRINFYHARLKLAHLTEDFDVIGNCDLHLDGATIEDGRLFHFRDELYCNFCQYYSSNWQRWTHKQHYAKITPFGKVLERYTLKWENEKPYEKNWQFFVHNDNLYAIYSINPHTILAVDGAVATQVHETNTKFYWRWGEVRGGTPPVLIGDEYYSFFHSWKSEGPLARKYYAGCYTFKAKPPFTVTRISREPILWADDDPKLYAKYHQWYRQGIQSVVFPSGALWENDEWVMSYGYQDAQCRIKKFKMEDLKLTSV